MYTYTFTSGSNINVKTPKVNNIKEIKFNADQTAECIKSRFEYPNGLVIETEQYCDKIVWVTNKRIILLENGALGFED